MKNKKEVFGVEVTGLTQSELEEASKVAMKIFDHFKDAEKFTLRQMFIIAFLKGHEFTLEQLGMFDDLDDGDETAKQFIKKYF